MSSSMSMVHGYLSADPEEHTYKKSDGTSGKFVTFCVPVDAKFGDATYFWDCTAFGKTGELIMAHFHKGKEIICYGEHMYKDKDKKRYWTLNVERIDFCGSKNGTTTNAPAEGATAPAGETMEEVTEDAPF